MHRWVVIETAYGKVIGRRRFMFLADAMETARTWRSQNAGVVTVERL